MFPETSEAARTAGQSRARRRLLAPGISFLLFLLFAVGTPAYADDPREDAALTPPGTEAGINLPNILGGADRALYRRIFDAQEKGAWRTADKLRRKLSNPVLTGHVLAQRYLHPTRYRSRYTELKKWLDRYADHPDARRIYKLALQRQPAGHRAPRKPVYRSGGVAAESAGTAAYRSPRKRSRTIQRRAAVMKSQVKRYVRRSQLKTALKYL